jgi:hypothetical protein
VRRERQHAGYDRRSPTGRSAVDKRYFDPCTGAQSERHSQEHADAERNRFTELAHDVFHRAREGIAGTDGKRNCFTGAESEREPFAEGERNRNAVARSERNALPLPQSRRR